MSFAVAFRYQEREYYTVLSNETDVSFGCHKKDHVQIPNSKDHLLYLRASAGKITASMQNPLSFPSNTITLNELITLNRDTGDRLYVSRITGKSEQSLNLPYTGRITCGRRSTNDIVLSFPIISGQHFQLLCDAGRVHVEDLNSTNHLYLNGKKISKAIMKSGDVLSIYTFRFLLENGVLYFENMKGGLTLSKKIENRQKVRETEPVSGHHTKDASGREQIQYLQYHLSPRTREQLPHDTIVLSSAPGQGPVGGGRRGNMAYLIGSGAMMAASLATGMVTPAALLVRAAGMISPIANMAIYGKMSKEEKKQLEEYEKLRQERYQAYIADQKARIEKVADVQRRIVSAENPSPDLCMKTVQDLRRSLWERMPSDSDFLMVRLGIGKQPLCVEVKSRADMDGFRMDDDELEQLSGQIIEETRYVDRMPVCVSLKDHQTIGIIGSKEKTFYQLRSMLVELTTQHCYKDVRLVCIFDESSRGRWGILRWLPHIWDETGQARYIAFDDKRRHTVCELLADLIRRRRMDAQENNKKKEQLVLPYYIVVVQKRELLLQESVYEDLISNNKALGMSTVFLAEAMYDLPQTCQYLVDLTDRPCAYEREKFDERSYFSQDEPVHQAQLEAFSRRMAAIELEDKKESAALPSALTFLQGYKVEMVEELQIQKRWEESEPYRTLAAPIGMMEGGKEFSLDIQSGEQSHGPHGLLAGTTGSGKSELLQTWILSMAVNYHPYDVNFVIIDYKGGGMSDLMEPLPHVVGKITNIDRNISRSLVSLKSELKRRQELFAKCGVNNINKYQKAYQDGEAKERLPHLIIVTDEFAEMKKEEPEFMTELNSVATVGRSLGIHMLLATQKPAGVVTDQINSNSRFRICMKVQDVADSREMLKRSDAARITQAGRAYIRVGEDEMFHLFQSFYSAAEYTGSKSGGMKLENQVRIVGVTGNRINLMKKHKNRDISDLDELTAVIQHINQVCEAQGIQKMPGPWLPELTKWLTFTDLDLPDRFDGTEWPKRSAGLSVPIGKYDVPALQRQGIQYLDFMSVGHYGVFGAPSTGKTTLLKTVIMALGVYYTPKDIDITVIDAGNWSLSEFADMPHVHEVILNQEEEKIGKFIQRMKKEMEVRKRAFLNHAVSSLTAYWETVSKELPAMMIVIDHIEPLFEQYMELEELLTDIAASGAGYGIYLIFTANSSLGIRYKFIQLIKGAITLQMSDKGDYASLVGPIAGISLPNVPGRALMKGNPPIAFQTAVYADAREENIRHVTVVQLIEQMRKAWSAEGQKKQENTESNADAGQNRELKQEYQERSRFSIGVNTETLETVWIDLSDPYLLLISSDSIQKNQKVLEKIEEGLAIREDNQIIHLDQDNYQEILDNLVGILNERKKHYNQRKKEENFNKKEWLEEHMQICLFVSDIVTFETGISVEAKKGFRRIFTMASGLGITIIAAGLREQLASKEPDILTHAAVLARNVLAFDRSPLEHCFSQCEMDSFQIETPLDQQEAALMQCGQLTILKFL